jgi:3-(3-hydroxy-phenyl)propionate hydroxylase
MDHFKVLIVGAGPSGLFMANLLGMHGIPTLCIEKNSELSNHPKATFLDSEIVRLLDTIGLLNECKGQIVGLSAIERYSSLGFLLTRENGVMTTHNYMHRNTIYQPWLEQCLLGGCKRYPELVEVRMGHELVELYQTENNGVECAIKDINSNEIITGFFTYVIGADGYKSKVREFSQIEFLPVTDYEAKSIRIDVEGTTDCSMVMRSGIDYATGRNWISFPAPNGRRFSFNVMKGENPEDLLTDEAAMNLIKPHVGNDPVRVIFKSHYHFRSRLASSLRKGNVFLIGDAAHTLPPAMAQGLNSGARDANMLAWRIAEVINRGVDESILEDYCKERYEPMKKIILQASNMYKAARHQGSKWKVYYNDILALTKNTFNWSGYFKSRINEVKKSDIIGKPVPNSWVQLTNSDDKGVLLDTLLKTSFCIVGFNIDKITDEMKNKLKESNYNVVLLYSKEYSKSNPNGCPLSELNGYQTGVISDHRFDEYLERVDKKWIVVRPDRIVAAYYQF